MSKPLINPSRYNTWLRCQFLYYVKYVLNKAPVRRLPHYMLFGTLFHTASYAYDSQRWWHGTEDWETALERECRNMRLLKTYDPADSALISYLADDIRRIMTGTRSYEALDGKTYEIEMEPKGGYITWRNNIQRQRKWTVLELERRAAVEIGPVIAAPKADGCIVEAGQAYALERKTTQQTAAQFDLKFRVDPQTTIEVLALEATLQRPIAGVYLLPVVYSRKKSKFWTLDLPQPLHRVTFEEPRPISKGTPVRNALRQQFTVFWNRVRQNRKSGEWEQNVLRCQENFAKCELWEVCWGTKALTDLVDRPEDDVHEALDRFMETNQ